MQITALASQCKAAVFVEEEGLACQSINQLIYLSCLQDSSGESTDNNWENNVHYALNVQRIRQQSTIDTMCFGQRDSTSRCDLQWGP